MWLNVLWTMVAAPWITSARGASINEFAVAIYVHMYVYVSAIIILTKLITILA